MSSNKRTLAECLDLGTEPRELTLGFTFSSKDSTTAFHTLKYDRKPANVDLNKKADVEFSIYSQVKITSPNVESSCPTNTVFKGNQKEYTHECVLVIDKITGEITLERLNQNIHVKKARIEAAYQTDRPLPKMGNVVKAVASNTMISAEALEKDMANSMQQMNTNQTQQQSQLRTPNRRTEHQTIQSQTNVWTRDHHPNIAELSLERSFLHESVPEVVSASMDALEFGFTPADYVDSSSGSDCSSDSDSCSEYDSGSEYDSNSGCLIQDWASLDTSSSDSDSDDEMGNNKSTQTMPDDFPPVRDSKPHRLKV